MALLGFSHHLMPWHNRDVITSLSQDSNLCQSVVEMHQTGGSAIFYQFKKIAVLKFLVTVEGPTELQRRGLFSQWIILSVKCVWGQENLELLGAVLSHPVTSGLADAVDGVEEVHLAAEGGHVDDEALLLLGHDSGKKRMLWIVLLLPKTVHQRTLCQEDFSQMALYQKGHRQ